MAKRRVNKFPKAFRKMALVPKVVVDRDEYTPRQRRLIDARLAKALEDVKKGRVHGPFGTVEQMLASLKAKGRKRASRSK